MFRAGRATDLSMKIPDQVVKNIMGWTPNSQAPQHYINITGEKQDSVLLELYGIKEKQDGMDVLKLLKCPRCSLENSPGNDMCKYCGLVLKSEKASEIEVERKIADMIMNELFKSDPEMEKKIREVKFRIGDKLKEMLK
jgi:hypothetical protein